MNTYPGIYRGLVTRTNDPEGLNRVKALVPQITGNDTTETDWAWPCFTPGLSVTLPNEGQGIWLMFIGADMDYPVWMGVWN